jgi:hypothetical protein
MDSLRAVAHAVTSPRVWAAVAVGSGWIFAGGVWVAGSARKSDVELVGETAKDAASAAAVASTRATDANRRALAAQESAALAYRALVGVLARDRARGARAELRDREQQAAQVRYDNAIHEGQTPASAVRTALPP